jgi:predicted nucleic acid-binding protein
VIVLDAYAVIAFIRDEPAAAPVGSLLRSDSQLVAPNLAEIVDKLVRVFGRRVDDVHARLALLERAGVRMVPADAELGLLAGELRARHYHHQRMPVSLADCFAAAHALRSQLPLATSDRPLATVVRAEGGEVLGLPDTAGRLPD